MSLPSLNDIGKFATEVIHDVVEAGKNAAAAKVNAEADRLAQLRVAQNAGQSFSSNLPVILLGAVVVILLLRRK